MQVDAAFIRQSVFHRSLAQPSQPPVSGAELVDEDRWCDAHSHVLMTSITQAAVAAEAGGSVPAALMVSTRNSLRELLCDSQAVFARMAQLIAGAQSEVLLQTFEWQDASTPAALLRHALHDLAWAQAARAAQGPVQPVVVRLMLRRSPVELFIGRDTGELETMIDALDPSLVQVELVEHHERLLGALHSKSLVIDGKTALLCGANVQSRFNAGSTWFDTGCILTGEVVAGLRADALQLWSRCRRRRCNAELDAPLPTACPVGVEDGIPMLVLSRRGNGNILNFNLHTPKDRGVLAALLAARTSIYMLTPNLNFPPVVQAIIAALRGGVRVYVILSDCFNDRGERRILAQGGNNRWVLWRIRRALRDEPEALKNFQVRWFSADGNVQVQGNRAGASHAKGLCIDGCVLIMGSFNFDTQSSRSREIGVAMGAPTAARRWLEGIFLPQFNRGVVA